jgi:hypothetical protein
MKRTMALVSAFLVLAVQVAEARVWTLSPEQTAVAATPVTTLEALPGGGGSFPPGTMTDAVEATVAEAFLHFNLTPVIEAGRPVSEVLLEWSFEGAPSDTLSYFYLYAVPESSSPSTGPEDVPHTSEENLIDVWEFSPVFLAAHGGGHIRFDLTQVAKQWASGAKANKGLVVKTADVSAKTLSDQVAKVTLVIR